MVKSRLFCCFGGKNAEGGTRGDGDQTATGDEPEGQNAINPQPEEGQSSAAITEPIIFTYSEIQAATNDFDELLLGLGHFEPVFKGTLESTGQEIMVKTLTNPDDILEFQLAIKKLWLLRHHNIVELIGFCACEGKMKYSVYGGNMKFVVYQFTPMTSLESQLHGGREKRRAMNWETRMKIAAGVAEAMQLLRIGGYVLIGGLKSSSILLDSEFKPRICDLGLLKLDMRSDPDGSASARLYYDPEFKQNSVAKPVLDVYAFGLLLFELISGRHPLALMSENGIIDQARTLVNGLEGGGSESFYALVDEEMGRDGISVFGLTKAVKLGLYCVKSPLIIRPQWDYVLDVLNNFTGPDAEEFSTDPSTWSRMIDREIRLAY